MARQVDTDVLVVGGGGAAARAALEASRRGARVAMVMKGTFGKSGATAYKVAEMAGYNFADGYPDPRDSPAEHLKDILNAAAGTCDERLAAILAEEAPRTIRDLEAWGVPLVKDGDRYLAVQGCFATRPRMHVVPGHAEPILAAMIEQLRTRDVAIFEDIIITQLLVVDGACAGAVGMSQDGEVIVFRAAATCMGTGGAGQLFFHNLNPADVTGDGYALAFRAGAELVNMEFMQCGPAIIHPVRNIFNGWVWMLHPPVYNAQGEEFLRRYVPEGMTVEECMDRRQGHYPFSRYDGSHWIDVAIQKEILEGRGAPEGGVFIDLSRTSEDTLPDNERGREVRKMWGITRQWLLKERGFDVTSQPVQVACFGHAINGGMRIEPTTESTLPGLFAAGEAAGGPHGADRLGGNMVVTCQVFGRRMGEHAAERARGLGNPGRVDAAAGVEEARLESLRGGRGTVTPLEMKKRIQKAMWKDLIVVRNEAKLRECLAELESIRGDWQSELTVDGPRGLWEALEVENMLTVGEIMARAALMRTESRGSHFREDYQEQEDPRWATSIVVSQANGKVGLRAEKLPQLS